MGVSFIVVAAGRGIRMGGVDKALLPVAGRPLIHHCLQRIQECGRATETIVVAREELCDPMRDLSRSFHPRPRVVPGGRSRFESVINGLDALTAGGDDLVAIHDVARPLVSSDLINRVLSAACRYGAAVPVLPVPDTIKRIPQPETDQIPGRVECTISRDNLRRVQTPQVFLHSLLVEAYRPLMSAKEEEAFTDDASIVEAAGQLVFAVPGDERNFKITTWHDYAVACALADRSPASHRVGLGYDSHRLAAGRRLVLGGVTIPGPSGLVGHSDGDVVLHAICDALLGACSMGDIGTHFPPGDPKWKGADSRVLLQGVLKMLNQQGGAAGSIDVTVVAERPRLAPFIQRMRTSIAQVAGVDERCVSVKAKTNEGMDAVGRGEGIAALAICTVTGAFGP
ncbi:MAG: 2-C-methyl-D-erythritol 2,4-cyclodiphosphate synthase [Bacillota bacterium]